MQRIMLLLVMFVMCTVPGTEAQARHGLHRSHRHHIYDRHVHLQGHHVVRPIVHRQPYRYPVHAYGHRPYRGVYVAGPGYAIGIGF